jgi:phosphate transport system ATP-binding protein
MWLGEIIEHGPAHEVLENPKHELTQSYVKGVIS